MPLFEYRCNQCSEVTEALLPTAVAAVECRHCSSPETVRLVSRFTLKSQRAEKYTEAFRERTLPFLKSRPGAQELLAEGGRSEEAAAFELTERIGARVDAALEGIHG
jgi:putative FmdB family regulatory protein